MQRKKTTFIVTDGDGGMRQLNLVGRTAQTLEALVKFGDAGITANTLGGPAIRISNYILALRRDHNLKISTTAEKHGGPFAGTHGRFRIKSNVTLSGLTGGAT